ncbi:hypothetical protein DPMN_040468 [Dreissena polymorpha]|uniref:Secreted protein n=1 Tax=Dreissena polymorpha TaxID=45954 RepID=A0A9D4CXS0_DREPO|nr:hypothetical protein DPMN_040468 [Dreissena polymorpha]
MTWIYVLFCVLFCGSTTGFLLDTITGHLPHQVCYGDLGCFSNGIPFLSTHRPLSVVPASPDTIGTRFLLYTRTLSTSSSSTGTQAQCCHTSRRQQTRALLAPSWPS